MHHIKAIFFDLDETLIENRLTVTDIFAHMYSDFTEELGMDTHREFFKALGARAKELWVNMFNCDASPEQQLVACFEKCIEATGNVHSARQFSLAQEMLEHFLYMSANNVQFQDNAEDVITELSQRGFRVGLITNGIEQVQMSKIKRLGLQQHLDTITISAQARAHKPEAPVFELALERTNVAAEHSFMVGDHPTNDVAGGIRAGLAGVYYNPKQHDIETAFSELAERPNHTIKSLPDILCLLS